jgi:hypothetical protein
VILGAIFGLFVFVIVVLVAAAVLSLASGRDGPFGRFFGPVVKDGQYSTPLGDFPPAEDPEFTRPDNESELL